MKKILIGIVTILFFLIYSNNAFTNLAYASMTDVASLPLQESDSSFLTIKDGILTKYTGNETTVVIPEGVTIIESWAFENNQVENLYLPDSLNIISPWAFHNCSNLKEITLPPNLEEIGTQAFMNCTSLVDIIIPQSTRYLGNNVFQGCSNLDNITIESNCNINVDMFIDTKWLEEQKKEQYVIVNDTLLTGKTSGAIIVPLGVKRIGERAFYGTNITSVETPSTLTNIDSSAFDNCTSLRKVIFARGLNEIGEYTFRNCKKLTTVTLPDTIEEIGDGTFYNCTSLHKIIFPDVMKSLPESVLAWCKNLESITFPKSLQTIGRGALDSTLWLKNAKKKNPMVIVNNILVDGTTCKGNVIIPDGITYITSNAFYGSSITSVTIPAGVTSLNNYTFGSCTKLKTVNLPSTLISINTGAFNQCQTLNKISMPKNLKTIGEYAFTGCSSLQSITFNIKLESIGDYAFKECIKLTSLAFPASLITIDNQAFSDCTALVKVNMKEGITQIDTRAFYNCTKLKDITFPTQSLVSIGNMAFHKTTWFTKAKKNHTMVIVGKVLYDASGCSGDVIIPDNVVMITGYSFNCRYRVDSIIIPPTVINIPHIAFFGCSDLITLIVREDSYAHEFAKDVHMRYVVR